MRVRQFYSFLFWLSIVIILPCIVLMSGNGLLFVCYCMRRELRSGIGEHQYMSSPGPAVMCRKPKTNRLCSRPPEISCADLR